MLNLLRRIEHEVVRPAVRKLRPSRYANFGGIRIKYRAELDGGGTEFGQDFISFFRARGMPQQDRIFEWCCGPAFIGFSLLGNGLCKSLCLADINPQAVASCRNTVSANSLMDRVSVYESDNLKKIPRSEKWNVVVSNPPHFIDQYIGDIRAHDPDWRIHREFLSTVAKFIDQNGVIVLQENNRGSTTETFRQMIEQAELKIVFIDGDAKTITERSSFYYIGIMRQADVPPVWATVRIERNDEGWIESAAR